ncbi:MAG: glycine cleavage system protein GcvH [Caldilineaceae bacterium]
MSEYKFEKHVKYAESHEWVRIEEGVAVVGISDTAQDLLSDVVFVELPEVGSEVKAGDEIAVVESVKAAENVLAPVSGVITAVNEELLDAPELVNETPYTAWFFKIQPTNKLETELAALMNADAYAKFVEETAH